MSAGSKRKAGAAAKEASALGGTNSSLLDADELRQALVALGLTQNESRAYLALLEGAAVSAAEAATRAGMPRPKIYEALAKLESRGFCRSFGGRVRSYTAVDPAEALDNWLRHRDDERVALAERDRAHVEQLVRLLPQPDQGPTVDVPDFIEAISGRLPTTEVLEDVISRAQSTLFGMMQPPFLQPRPRWNTSEIAALERGVEVRMIFTPEGLTDPHRVTGLLDAGGKVRVIDRLPMKLLIRDHEESLISLRDANTGAQSVTTARVRHPDLIAPLETLFKQFWRKAEPLDHA